MSAAKGRGPNRITLPWGKVVSFPGAGATSGAPASRASAGAAPPVKHKIRLTLPGGRGLWVSAKAPPKGLVSLTLPGGRRVDLRLHAPRRG